MRQSEEDVLGHVKAAAPLVVGPGLESDGPVFVAAWKLPCAPRFGEEGQKKVHRRTRDKILATALDPEMSLVTPGQEQQLLCIALQEAIQPFPLGLCKEMSPADKKLPG